jgi:hypothetical protein
MKFELKHLTAYLPYETKVIENEDFIATMSIDHNWPKREVCINRIYLFPALYKLILRPLSDLVEEIKHGDEKFIPVDRFCANTKELEIKHTIMKTPYWVVVKLLEWHFDVFRLIDKGLAIDIKTLNQN